LFTVAKSPLTVMLDTASAPVPMFVSDTNCGGDVVESVCALKPSVPGKSARPEPAARGAIACGAGARRAPVGADAAVRAVVETGRVEGTGFGPGVTVGGSNAHVVCGGRLPLAQLSVISVLYAPFCGVIVTTCVLVAPAGSVAIGGATSSAKSLTTICRSAVGP